MTDPISPADAALLAELRAVLGEVDTPPPDVVAAAKSSFTWRTVDAELAELAELAFDSLVDADAGALVRGNEQSRMLTFRAGTVEIELEATPAGSGFHLVGQIIPASPGQGGARHPARPGAIPVDELGRFTVDGVATGAVSFHWRPT